ncbi:MAG: hypothetical protein IJT58_02580 [Synergistaceae bacterium]|nr:hypothetical protein [Synergistaceae bacterium]
MIKINNLIALADDFFLWIAQNYRAELYMAGTRLAGVLCSFADITMIWMFLKLCDEINGKISRKSYTVLKIFAVLTPSLLLVKNSTIFFPLQGFVLSGPYFILVLTAVKEAPGLLAHIKEVLHNRGHKDL